MIIKLIILYIEKHVAIKRSFNDTQITEKKTEALTLNDEIQFQFNLRVGLKNKRLRQRTRCQFVVSFVCGR